MPGQKWVTNFLKRHKNVLTVRSTNNIKESRASKSVKVYNTYFENLKISLHNVKPDHIVNYDETNFSDNPGSQKCIFKAGTKYPNKTLNNTKAAISVMFSATASGEIFSPYVVCKADNLWTNWCANGPEGTRYNKTKSGWFDSYTFVDWFNTIIIPWAVKTTDPKVLIGDNLSSHMNVNRISFDDSVSDHYTKHEKVFPKSRSSQGSSSESSGMYTVHDSSCDEHFLPSLSDTETYIDEMYEELEQNIDKENDMYEIGIDKYVPVKFSTSKLAVCLRNNFT
ncbi:unnamed protein product [Parnassius apollo]|uniref:(apollo) hypothetical protein n=1 Tax=Parnassius apollo TaxID=110799 RepID=A0A8S3XPH0_PARAO|nr:unnamed protein product [Parnassius apollo]